VNDNGQPPEEPPQLTQEEIHKIMQAEIGGMLQGLAVSFADHFPQERLGEVVEAMIAEQKIVGEQIMPSLIDPARYEKGRIFLIEIKRRGEPDNTAFTMSMPKRLEGIENPHEALAQALMLAFLLSPAVRGLLRLWGWDYLFKEPKHGSTPGTSLKSALKLVKG
jgi:hypothetical protein